MSIFKPYKINENQLNNIPIKEGQIFFILDSSKIFLDKNDTERVGFFNDAAYDSKGSAAAAELNSKNYTDSEILKLINGAPETLDTLRELAEAIEENEEVTDVLNAAIGNKVDKESGEGRSISYGQFPASSVGWYRIAEYVENGGGSSLGSMVGANPYSCTVKVQRNYNSNSSESYEFHLISTYNGSQIDQVYGLTQNQLITHTRHTIDRSVNKTYLEIYYNGSSPNMIYTTIIGGNTPEGKWIALKEPVMMVSTESEWYKLALKPQFNMNDLVVRGEATALTSSAGSATQPIYFSGGKPIACSYTLGKSVPSNAVFTDTTYSVMNGCTASNAGREGLVPAPPAGKQLSFLRGDGSWIVPTNTTYSAATQSAAGLMSADDKKKLDGIAGQNVPRDGSLTIQRNGSNIKTFTENKGTDVVVNILVPTKVSELTNDSGFKTTWRGIQNNLNSDSTEESLSAAQGKILKNSIDIVTTGIVNKNNIYRGKNLTNIYTIDKICARIANGTFEDLYIGDYFDITITTEYSTNEKVRCIIAGFDVFLFNGDTPLTSHHAVIVMKNCFAKTHQMNSTNTTEGGYVGSNMYKTVLPKYATAIGTVLGSHLLTYRNLFSNTVNSSVSNPRAGGNSWGAGVASDWSWYDTKLCLLNEINVYGSIALSSSGYDVGIQNTQLPLFKLDPSARMCRVGGIDNVLSSTRCWWWLRDVVSSSVFASVSSYGGSDCGGASNSRGVRGFWLIG